MSIDRFRSFFSVAETADLQIGRRPSLMPVHSRSIQLERFGRLFLIVLLQLLFLPGWGQLPRLWESGRWLPFFLFITVNGLTWLLLFGSIALKAGRRPPGSER